MTGIIIGIIALLGISVWFVSFSLPYPEPKGKFNVGTVLMELEDPSRKEWALSEKNQSRKFVVRIWYPANPTGNETMLPIMEKPFSKGIQDLYGFPGGKEKPSQSYIDAPVCLGDALFPVLIFTHGAGSFMTQNLTSMEELASQGFMVISVSFPYESVAAIFPDGSVVRMKDMEKFKKDMSILSKNKEFASLFAKNIEDMKNPDPNKANAACITLGKRYLQLYPDIKIWLETRMADIEYLINAFDEIRIQEYKFSDIADTRNIGLFGHSLGALTTLKFLMEKDIPAVKCGVALDVPFFNIDSTADISLKAPVLFMSSDFIKIADSKVKLKGVNDFLKHYTNKTLYECNVKGTAHHNFSDMNYLPRFMKFTPMLGSISQKEAAKIMSYYLNVYFKGHLKGEDFNKLKDSISSEVIFREITQ